MIQARSFSAFKRLISISKLQPGHWVCMCCSPSVRSGDHQIPSHVRVAPHIVCLRLDLLDFIVQVTIESRVGVRSYHQVTYRRPRLIKFWWSRAHLCVWALILSILRTFLSAWTLLFRHFSFFFRSWNHCRFWKDRHFKAFWVSEILLIFKFLVLWIAEIFVDRRLHIVHGNIRGNQVWNCCSSMSRHCCQRQSLFKKFQHSYHCLNFTQHQFFFAVKNWSGASDWRFFCCSAFHFKLLNYF